MRNILSIAIIFCSTCGLYAELIWDRTDGWTTERNDGLVIRSDDFAVLELMNDARAAQEDGKFSVALAKYEKVYKQYRDSIFAPEAYYQTGKIREQKHQYKSAFKAFRAVIDKYPQYPGFTKVLHEQFELASLLKSGSRPYYFGIIPGFRDRVSAIEYYENIVRTAPYNELAPLALVNIAELYLRDKRPADAIDALDRLIDGYPNSEYTPRAYLKIAKIYAGLVKSTKHDPGAIQEAIHYYEDFLILYPTHEDVKEAEIQLDKMKTRLAQSKIDIGDFYFQARNNPRAAVIMYNEAITTYPGSAIAESAKNKIEYVKSGHRPRRTPVDFFFGRYKRPSDEAWIAEATIDEIINERFEDSSEAIFKHNNGPMHSLSDSDQGAVNTDFVKPAPQTETEIPESPEQVQNDSEKITTLEEVAPEHPVPGETNVDKHESNPSLEEPVVVEDGSQKADQGESKAVRKTRRKYR